MLAQVLPEADVPALTALVAEEARQGVAPDAFRRLAALLPPDPALAEQVAARFRLSGAQKKRLALAAARNNNSPSSSEEGLGGGGDAQHRSRSDKDAFSETPPRSEERRVGKECA